MMKFFFLLIGLLLGASAPASAQTPANCGVNFNPVVGVNCANIRQATYSVSINAMVPVAAATDIFCISAGASKNVHVRQIMVAGTAGTLITTPMDINLHTTLDTGTISTSIKAKVPWSANNPAANAVIAAYDSTSGNPTITDTTSHNVMLASKLTWPLSGTSAMPADRFVWNLTSDPYNQGGDLQKGSTRQICLNLGAATVSSGLVESTIVWTED